MNARPSTDHSLLRVGSAFALQIGKVLIFNGFLRDIAARKKAAIELQTVNRQLIDVPRQAGVAGVATSVLHNVGNMLNSINRLARTSTKFFKGAIFVLELPEKTPSTPPYSVELKTQR